MSALLCFLPLRLSSMTDKLEPLTTRHDNWATVNVSGATEYPLVDKRKSVLLLVWSCLPLFPLFSHWRLRAGEFRAWVIFSLPAVESVQLLVSFRRRDGAIAHFAFIRDCMKKGAWFFLFSSRSNFDSASSALYLDVGDILIEWARDKLAGVGLAVDRSIVLPRPSLSFNKIWTGSNLWRESKMRTREQDKNKRTFFLLFCWPAFVYPYVLC